MHRNKNQRQLSLSQLQQINFHNHWTNKIRKETGASYVSFVRYNDSYFLKVNKGGVTLQPIPLEGKPEDITSDSYIALLNHLKE